MLHLQVSKRFMDKTHKERILLALQRLEQNLGKVDNNSFTSQYFRVYTWNNLNLFNINTFTKMWVKLGSYFKICLDVSLLSSREIKNSGDQQ